MYKLRTFDTVDWSGMAGATPFSDSTDPMISDDIPVKKWPQFEGYEKSETVNLIVDGNGVSVMGVNTQYSWDNSPGSFDKYPALLIAYGCLRLFEEQGGVDSDELERWGFERIV